MAVLKVMRMGAELCARLSIRLNIGLSTGRRDEFDTVTRDTRYSCVR